MLYKIYRKLVLFFCRNKRRQRIAELKRTIILLSEPKHHRLAAEYLRRCCQIVERYQVNLLEVKFQGTLEDLRSLACESYRQYVDDFRVSLTDDWIFDDVPDEMGLIKPRNKDFDGFNSIQKFGEMSRRLKRLERQLRNFPHTTRAILMEGRVFSCLNTIFPLK